MTTSEQLEREAEHTRSQIVDTLAELRSQMTPGQILDQALDYARGGKAGEFARNLGRQVVSNPLPVVLIAAGIGWLAFGGTRNGAGPSIRQGGADWTHRARYRVEDWKQRTGETTEQWSARTQSMAVEAADRARRSADEWQRRIGAARAEVGETADAWADEVRHTGEDWAQRASETAEAWANRVETMASDMAERARHTVGAWRHRAESARSALSHGATEAYDRTARGARHAVDAFGRSASTFGSGAADRTRSFTGYVKNEPLVLVGIGLALGAVVGAAIPESDAENDWMGDRSDALKTQAAAAAEEQWEKGKQVVESAWEEGKHEAARQGFIPEGDKAGEQTGQASLVPETEQPERLSATTQRPAD